MKSSGRMLMVHLQLEFTLFLILFFNRFFLNRYHI